MIIWQKVIELYYNINIIMVHLGKNGKGMQKGQNCGVIVMDFML